MPRCLPVASCKIVDIDETGVAQRLIRNRNVRKPRRAARRQLPQRILNEVRAESEDFQERAHFLKMMKRALTRGLGIIAIRIRYERHPERCASATDRAVNLECSFVGCCCRHVLLPLPFQAVVLCCAYAVCHLTLEIS